jgi:hypothetical protein
MSAEHSSNFRLDEMLSISTMRPYRALRRDSNAQLGLSDPNPAPAIRANRALDGLTCIRGDEQFTIRAVLVAIRCVPIGNGSLRGFRSIRCTHAQSENGSNAESCTKQTPARRYCCSKLFAHELPLCDRQNRSLQFFSANFADKMRIALPKLRTVSRIFISRLFLLHLRNTFKERPSVTIWSVRYSILRA